MQGEELIGEGPLFVHPSSSLQLHSRHQSFTSVWSRFSLCPSLDSVRLVTIRTMFLYPLMHNCYSVSATDESGVDFTSSPIRSLMPYPIQALCSADQSVILRRFDVFRRLEREGEAPVIPPLPPDSHYPSHFNCHESRRRWIRMLIDNRSTHITPIDQLPSGRRRPVCYLGASTRQRMRSLDPLAAPKTAPLPLLQLLNDHSEHEVDLYESADYIGGHTHTVQFKRE